MAKPKQTIQCDEQARLVKLAHVGRGDLIRQGKFRPLKAGGNEDWQQLCQSVTESIPLVGDGKNSTSDMSVAELKRLMATLYGKGFSPKHINNKSPRPTDAGGRGKSRAIATDAESSKLRAIWLEMADLGIVRDRSESALCNMAGRILFGKKTTVLLQTLTNAQMEKAIESLKKMRRREMLTGELFCPECGRLVSPNLLEPFLRKYGQMGCPAHDVMVPFAWRMRGGAA